MHCTCPRHAGHGEGLFARYEDALRADDTKTVDLLLNEIRHIAATLRKSNAPA